MMLARPSTFTDLYYAPCSRQLSSSDFQYTYVPGVYINGIIMFEHFMVYKCLSEIRFNFLLFQ